jgi:hypothetical protein
MQWIAGSALGLLLAVSVFLFVRGLAGVFRKRWRSAIAILAGVGLFLLQILLVTVVAYLLGPAGLDGTTIGPSNKARILAERISELMNISFWGGPFGLLLGLVQGVRDWRGSGTAA